MKFQKAKPGSGHRGETSVKKEARNRIALMEVQKAASLLLSCMLAAFWAPKAYAAESKRAQVEILIARDEVSDPYFHHSVVVMLPESESQLTVGLIINKPTRVTVGKLFPDSPELKNQTDHAYFGGPVEIRTPSVVFRSQKALDNAVRLSGNVYLTFDPDLISSVFQSAKPGSGLRLFLGRAQWAPGQLENEIRMGGWYKIEADGDLVFSADPDDLWPRLHARAAPSKYIRYRLPSGGSYRSTRKVLVM
ncbi:MAG: YqgE/AlgH family protein [Acidobacteria bacterium]|nr:MAG: YqgE/AlgH family protein [Acidobacteriota bacterium]